MANYMIEIDHLHVQLNHKTIHEDLSLTVEKGEKLAITGESGAGKSTILNVLAGFIPQFKGDVSIDGIPLNAKNIAQIRSKMAWLPQDTSLNVQTVEELFLEPFLLDINKDNKPSQTEIDKIFNAFELSKNLLERDVREISGGQKQRIILASCLLLHKPLMLIDEPTSALDKGIKTKVTDYVLSNPNLTVVAVTHDDYWTQKSDRVLQLK